MTLGTRYHMLRWGVSSLAVILLGLSSGCTRAGHGATTPETAADETSTAAAIVPPVEQILSEEALADEEIRNAISVELRLNDAVRADLIEVSVTEGVVTLRGQVRSLLAEQEAKRSAELIRGVRSIVDLLEVQAAEREEGELLTDVQNALLFDAATDSLGVAASVDGATVVLTGEVGSWQQRALVERVVAGVRGVREVDNRLEIDPDVPRTGEEILSDVRGRLVTNRWIDEEALSVTVEDGHVTISGVVDNATARTLAERAGWVAGATSVDAEGVTVVPRVEGAPERSPGSLYDLTDEEVASAVRTAFVYDPRVFSFQPQVSVDDGVVTLTGAVDSVAARQAAEETAMNTVGVYRVRDYLHVRPEEQVSDEDLEERIGATLAWNPWIERHDIRVDASLGTVYLYGEVDNDFERREAGRAAAHLSGVHQVENMLEVRDGQEEPQPDWLVEQQIEAQLFWDPHVISDNVEVEVEGERATLTGAVRDWRAYNAAITNAHQGGAAEVVARLTIEAPTPDYLRP